MGIKELFQGFAIFQQGVNTANRIGAVDEANESLQALNDQGLELQERLEKERQIGQRLGLGLQRAGANAKQIQVATQSFGVSAGALFQAEINKELQENTIKAQQEQAKALAEQAKALQAQRDVAAQQRVTTQQRGAAERTELTTEATVGAARIKVEQAQKEADKKRIREERKLQIQGFIRNPDFKGIPSDQDVKDIKKASTSTRKILPTLNRLREEFEKEGTSIFKRESRAKMQQLATQLKLVFKSEAFAGLGVIAGPDERLLNDVVEDPSILELDSTARAKFLGFGKIVSDAMDAAAKSGGFLIDPTSEIGKGLQDARTPPLDPSIKKELDDLAEQIPAIKQQQTMIELVIRDPEHPEHEGVKAMLLRKGKFDVLRQTKPVQSRPQEFP